MRSSSAWSLLLLLLLALLPLLPCWADNYGVGYPGGSQSLFNNDLGAANVLYCSFPMSITARPQVLATVGTTWDPTNPGSGSFIFPSNISLRAGLYTVATATNAYTLIAAANQNASIPFPGYNASMPFPSFFPTSNFTYFPPFNGTLSPATNYSACVGTNAGWALRYGQGMAGNPTSGLLIPFLFDGGVPSLFTPTFNFNNFEAVWWQTTATLQFSSSAVSSSAVSSSAVRSSAVSSSALSSSAVSSSSALASFLPSSSSALPTSAAAAGSCSVTIPSNQVSVVASFNFSAVGDSLGCMTSDATRLKGFAGSTSGAIYAFSFTAIPALIQPVFLAGNGQTGASYVACVAAPDGSALYLVDTRAATLQRYTPSTPNVGPIIVGTFPAESTGTLTSLAIDFTSHIAYIGTRQTDNIYTVPFNSVGQSFGAFLYANPTNQDVLSLALSPDLSTLYYGAPSPSLGGSGVIFSLPVQQGIILDSQSPVTLVADPRIVFPDGLLIDPTGTVLYVKDGGLVQALGSSLQESVQYIFNVSLTSATPQLNVMLGSLTINLPNGAVVQNTGQNLYFTAGQTLDQISIVPQVIQTVCPSSMSAASSSSTFSSSPVSSSAVSSSVISSSVFSSSAVSSSAVSSSVFSSSPAASSVLSSSPRSSSAVSSSVFSSSRVSSSAVSSSAFSSSPVSSSVFSSSPVSSSVIPTSAAAAGSCPPTVIPVNQVSVVAPFNFSAVGDSLGCMTSDATRLKGFAGSTSGAIYAFSFTAIPALIQPVFLAGNGQTGASYVACVAAPDGSALYLVDTRAATLQRYTPSTPNVGPIIVGTFPAESTGTLTSLAIDFTSHIAYIGTRQTDNIYTVPFNSVGQSFGAFLYANPTNQDVLSLALSPDLSTLYYGAPSPSLGGSGVIFSLPVQQGIILDSQSPVTLVADPRIVFPDGLLIDPTGTVLYVKDGGLVQALGSSLQESVQYIFNVSLTSATPQLNVMLGSLTINLPNGAVVQNTGQNLYFTAGQTLDQISIVPQFIQGICPSSVSSISSSPVSSSVFSSSPVSSSAVSSSAFSSSPVSSSAVSSSIFSSSPVSSSVFSSSPVSSSAVSSSVFSSSPVSSSVFSSSPVSSSVFSSSPVSSSAVSSSVFSSSAVSSSVFSSSPVSSSAVSSSPVSSSVFSSSPVSSSAVSSSAVSSSVVSSSAVSSSAVSSSVVSSSAVSSSAVSSSPVSSSVVSSSVVSSSAVSSSVLSSSPVSSSAVSSSVFSSSPVSSSAVSSSVVSSSAVSSSVASSSIITSAVAATSPGVASASSSPAVMSSSSSTGPAAAFSDPRFRGFWGQSFYVGGAVGGVYNLLSDAEVQVNAEFVYLRNITCPDVDGARMERCFEHEGTYFGSLSISVQGGDALLLRGGAHDSGFRSVQLLDDEVQREVQVGDAVTAAAAEKMGAAALLKSAALPTLSVVRVSPRSVQVQAGVYRMTMDNADMYVDITTLDISCWECVSERLQPEGLLGQTWNSTAIIRQTDDEVEQYREQHNDLTGCLHTHDKFCTTKA